MPIEPPTIQIAWEPVTGPDAEKVLRETYRKLLFEPDDGPVENGFDG